MLPGRAKLGDSRSDLPVQRHGRARRPRRGPRLGCRRCVFRWQDLQTADLGGLRGREPPDPRGEAPADLEQLQKQVDGAAVGHDLRRQRARRRRPRLHVALGREERGRDGSVVRAGRDAERDHHGADPCLRGREEQGGGGCWFEEEGQGAAAQVDGGGCGGASSSFFFFFLPGEERDARKERQGFFFRCCFCADEEDSGEGREEKVRVSGEKEREKRREKDSVKREREEKNIKRE